MHRNSASLLGRLRLGEVENIAGRVGSHPLDCLLCPLLHPRCAPHLDRCRTRSDVSCVGSRAAASDTSSRDTMSWFSRKPTQQKYLEAAITVATNLYLHTIPEAEDAPAPLQFSLPDSRARYMIFCLSAVLTAALAYDEKKQIQPEALIKGCLRAANLIATKDAQEYLGGSASSQDSVENASAYLKEFLKHWSRWPELEKEGGNAEIIDLISSMIHTTESNLPAEKTDMQRLGDLALWIDCRLPTMRGALIELTNR